MGKSGRLPETCPSCRQKQDRNDYESQLAQLMGAWDELDASSEGITVSDVLERFKQSSQNFASARAILLDLGSVKQLKIALSHAKGIVLNGRRFEVVGKRDREAVWSLRTVQ